MEPATILSVAVAGVVLAGLVAAVATAPGHDSPGYRTEESCLQYNVLKLAQHLFQWAPTAALGDDYEIRA